MLVHIYKIHNFWHANHWHDTAPWDGVENYNGNYVVTDGYPKRYVAFTDEQVGEHWAAENCRAYDSMFVEYGALTATLALLNG